MEMVLIKNGSNEWNKMWETLSAHPVNEGIETPEVALNELNGEVWQYMGSFRNNGELIHEFRHRSHPKTNDRVLYKFNASSEITDEDIDKIIPIR